jgi:hypothetical protein
VKPNYALVVIPLSGVLKCDRPGCGYKTEQIKLEPKNIPSLIGTPCPQCGANLLTEADAKSLLLMFRVAAILNFVCFPLFLLRQIGVWLHLCRPPKWARCRCESMDGSGAIKFSQPEPLKEDEQ